ncbi:MAG: hypothetical protein R3C42_02645 [Parvularculaceae bacterium]|nr:hypothetical protein [Parvularculaceae bacterium]
MRPLLALLAFALINACAERPDDAAASAQNTAQSDEAMAEDAAAGDIVDVTGGAGKTIEEMRAQSLEAIDTQDCEARGGEVRPEGMLGMYRCVTPYADAGSPCRSGGDCEGKCLADDDTPVGGETVGVCQADDSPFGCYAEIEDGKVTTALCVD